MEDPPLWATSALLGTEGSTPDFLIFEGEGGEHPTGYWGSRAQAVMNATPSSITFKQQATLSVVVGGGMLAVGGVAVALGTVDIGRLVLAAGAIAGAAALSFVSTRLRKAREAAAPSRYADCALRVKLDGVEPSWAIDRVREVMRSLSSSTASTDSVAGSLEAWEADALLPAVWVSPGSSRNELLICVRGDGDAGTIARLKGAVERALYA